MPQSFDQVYQSMVWMWKEVKQADPDNALRFCQGWLNYAKEYFQLKKWPFSMLKVCLQRGPTNFMRPRDVVKMMLFFYGNKLPYICAGHWVLIRIGISNSDRKDHRAKQAINRILQSYLVAKRNGKVLRYFDLKQRRYMPIDQ